MRKISFQISLLMGLTMSLVLSIVGNVTGGGNRPVPAIITGIAISFVISFVISIIIGLVVPMKKVNDAVCRAAKTSPYSLKGKLATSFVSDLIYTPIITLAMTFMAWQQMPEEAKAHIPGYPAFFLKSLAICFIVGWVVAFIFQPLYQKIIFKKNGVEV